MSFSILHAFYWSEKLIAFAVVLQTLELLRIRQTFTEDGVWIWSTLREEFKIFPSFIRLPLDYLLDYPHFLIVLLARLLAAFLLFFFSHPAILLVMLFGTVLIALRWRGTFNGGSDYMTLILLISLSIWSFFPSNPWVSLACVCYIAISALFIVFHRWPCEAKEQKLAKWNSTSGILERYNLRADSRS